MAAGDSIVGICNIGLIELGQPPITSLSDPVKAAIYCNARYDQVRREMLRAHPWNSARAQAQLSASTTAPLFKWANAFPLPADFIRMFRMPDNAEARYEIVGPVLMTDETAPLNIEYIFNLTDPTKFDPLFVTALGYAVGAAVAMPLVQKAAERTRLDNLVEAKLSIARLIGSQESSVQEWDDDVLLRSRA